MLATRRSARVFDKGPLSARALGSLFSAFADAEGTSGEVRRRAWPSAGGLYPLEVFACRLAVDHPLNGRAVHYEPDTHGLTDLAPAPAWPALAAPLSATGVITGTPQVVVLFVLDTAAMEAKYATRAGRFALIEVGHAAENLALRLAADGLAGCELGGTHDRSLLAALGLTGSGARLALRYACGRSPTPPRRRRI